MTGLLISPALFLYFSLGRGNRPPSFPSGMHLLFLHYRWGGKKERGKKVRVHLYKFLFISSTPAFLAEHVG